MATLYFVYLYTMCEVYTCRKLKQCKSGYPELSNEISECHLRIATNLTNKEIQNTVIHV